MLRTSKFGILDRMLTSLSPQPQQLRLRTASRLLALERFRTSSSVKLIAESALFLIKAHHIGYYSNTDEKTGDGKKMATLTLQQKPAFVRPSRTYDYLYGEYMKQKMLRRRIVCLFQRLLCAKSLDGA